MHAAVKEWIAYIKQMKSKITNTKYYKDYS